MFKASRTQWYVNNAISETLYSCGHRDIKLPSMLVTVGSGVAMTLPVEPVSGAKVCGHPAVL